MTRRAASLCSLLAACAVLAAIGAAVLDDYGVSLDEVSRLRSAEINWRYIIGEGELRFELPPTRYYGVAFDLPLLLAGEALGIDDRRRILLLRHAASYVLFLAGALCCGLLARRMTGSTAIALLALALFVLQPRIYAHSFFNHKDVPALALFAACLWLAHRAFRSGGAGAFLLCGAAAAALTNLRIPAGLVLVAAVLAARVLDLALASDAAARVPGTAGVSPASWRPNGAYAGRRDAGGPRKSGPGACSVHNENCRSGWAERRRVLSSLAAFAAGWTGVLYAISPYMWADGPAAFVDAVATLARHPHVTPVLFQGRVLSPSDLPALYFPVWFAISTPPVLLALGLAGFAVALRRGLARPGAALRNTPARFALLAAACWAGPQLAVALLGAHAYGGWRHMFFLHAPFCVLAALGAAAAARAARRLAGGGGTALGALAGAGAAAAAIGAILLHPHQQVYFNGLKDRTTPWRIRERYDFGYRGPAFRAGLERALAERPGAEIRVCAPPGGHPNKNARILRPGDRARLSVVGLHDACDVAFSYPRRAVFEGHLGDRPIVRAAWSLAAWGSSFLDAFDMDEARAARRRMDAPILARPPDIAARFDVRVVDRGLIYARDDCAPEDLEPRFFLHVEPADPADLPEDRRRHGFDNLDFEPRGWKTPAYPPPRRATWERIDGRCVVRAPLPGYPVRRIRTGQFVDDGAGGLRSLWEGEIDVAGAGRR